MIDDYWGPLFNPEEARRRRDDGMSQVSDHNKDWLQNCYDEAERFISSRDEFTGEDIRYHCTATVGYPKHHNAWGAMINGLVVKGRIIATGEYRPMRDEVSHARRTPVYKKVENGKNLVDRKTEV